MASKVEELHCCLRFRNSSQKGGGGGEGGVKERYLPGNPLQHQRSLDVAKK